MMTEAKRSGTGMEAAENRFYGVYPAVVQDNRDPHSQGRVRIILPVMGDKFSLKTELWARVAVPLAGMNRGTWFIPEVGDEVLVAFEAGDTRRPYVVGSLWNGIDMPPEQMSNENDVKSIVSRSGVRITLDDHSSQISLRLETPSGRAVTLHDQTGVIEIRDNQGNSVQITARGITIDTGGKLEINASVAEINTSLLTVNTGMAKFSGVVQCDTMIANSVVAASYTPGEGNIW